MGRAFGSQNNCQNKDNDITTETVIPVPALDLAIVKIMAQDPSHALSLAQPDCFMPDCTAEFFVDYYHIQSDIFP